MHKLLWVKNNIRTFFIQYVIFEIRCVEWSLTIEVALTLRPLLWWRNCIHILNHIVYGGLTRMERFEWLNKFMCLFHKQIYHNEVLCDMAQMSSSYVLLGCLWQFDKDVTYNGWKNTFLFMLNKKKVHLLPMNSW
jgi:hypothetical protein